MIKLALIGKGPWGNNYIRTIANLKNCVLPKEFIRAKDYKELFKYKKDIDGVIIATPPTTHFKIAYDVLSHGLPVLVEKPVATSLLHAKKLLEIQKKRKLNAMVGHIYLYHSAFRAMKKQIQVIGKIHYIATEGMDYGPIRSDVSALWDWAAHDISMTMDLLNQKPTSVFGWGVKRNAKNGGIDMCYIRLQFNTIPVVISIGWLSPVKKRSMTVVGETGSILFDDTKIDKLILLKNLKLKRQVKKIKYNESLPLTQEVIAFVDCIIKREEPLASLQQGADVVYVIESIQKSIMNNGREIRLNF